MCDNPLSAKLEKQDSNETITVTPNPISIKFIGPTMKDPFSPATFSSKPNTKVIFSNGVSLNVVQNICQSSDTTLTFQALIEIGKIKSGPYIDSGGEIEFRDLFFNFFNVKYNTNITYQFDPKLVCAESVPQTYNIDNRPFQVVVTSISYDKSKYFATNTEDETNINKFEMDLVDLFLSTDASGSLVQFHNQILNALLNKSGFGRKVEKEIDRIYCAQNAETKIVNTYILYEQKIKRLQQNGLYSLISKS
jgi:hypothetical protein